MKRTIAIALACALGLVFGAVNAEAISLTYGDGFYLGRIVDGVPSNPTDSASYINSVKVLAAGALATPCSLAITENCDRVGSTLVGGFTTAVVTGTVKYETPPLSGSFNSTGFLYVLGKYGGGGQSDGGTWVWFLNGGQTSVTLPQSFGAGGPGLSHIEFFNQVPDGGATLMLLGGALVGLGALRRKFSA